MVKVSDTQQTTATVKLKDKKGNATTCKPGTGVWKVEDEGVATVEPDPSNELQAVIKGVAPGVTKVTFECDGNNDGVGDAILISLFGAVEVTSGDADANSSTIEGGEVTEQGN